MPASQDRTAAASRTSARRPAISPPLQAFVNTLDIEQGTDALATPAGLDAWLRDAGLIAAAGGRSGPGELATAVELREALRGVLRSHVTHKAPGTRSRIRRRPAGADPAGAARAIVAAMQAGIHAEPDGSVVVVPAEAAPAAALAGCC